MVSKEDNLDASHPESPTKPRGSIDEQLKTEIENLPVIGMQEGDTPTIAVSIDNQSVITLNFFRCTLHLNDDTFKWVLKKSQGAVSLYTDRLGVKVQGNGQEQLRNDLDYTMQTQQINNTFFTDFQLQLLLLFIIYSNTESF